MSNIVFKNVSKIYQTANGCEKYALKDINVTITKGLVCILGKSGSGKSTLLNMVGLLDNPTNGNVIIDGKYTNKLNAKSKNKYHIKTCGFIFQHYHLLENLTASENVILPALIYGISKRRAKAKAQELLIEFGFDKSQINKKVDKYSGGERERIAIARSIINDPEILLADEPTGALDSTNSENVMEILKKLSKDRIVLMVTHNNEIAEKYADRIIKIEDGKIIEDINKNNVEILETKKHKKSFHINNSWSGSIVISNLIRRFKRNLISVISLSICIVATLLIVGFSLGSSVSIDFETQKLFDLGTGSVSKEITEKLDKSSLSLVKTLRPSYEEIDMLKNNNPDFVFGINYDAILSGYNFYIGEDTLNELVYTKVYSFEEESVNYELLTKGIIPNDTLDEAVINESAYRYLKEKYKFDPLDNFLEIKAINEVTYYTGEETKPYINDIFVFEKRIKIKSVVKELSFLSTPKVFYSYVALEEYMENTLLNNLSTYFEKDINWYQRIKETSNNSELSSYSYDVFLKDIKKPSLLKDNNLEDGDIKYSNPSLIVGKTLKDLIDASCVGMELFLVIAIVGSCLILGILSLSSYSEDRKSCAILSCLGASKEQIEEIYLNENILLGLTSIFISFAITILLIKPINSFISLIFGMSNMIVIPFKSFLNIPLGLPLIVVSAVLVLATFATIIPIKASKKISLKEELADE